MLSILSASLRHRHNILHAIVLSGLLALSIYNAYWVIDAYFNDNSSTNVVVKTANNLLPFANFITVHYRFANGGVFPQSWRTPDRIFKKEGVYWPAVAQSRKNISNTFGRNVTISEDSPLEHLFAIAETTQAVQYFDTQAIRNFIAQGDRSANNTRFKFDLSSSGLINSADDSEEEARVISAVNAFVNDSNCDAAAEAAANAVLSSDFAHSFTPLDRNISVLLNVDRLTDKSIEVTIPLDFVQNATRPTVYLGVIPIGNVSFVPALSDLSLSFAPFTAIGSLALNLGEDDLLKFRNYSVLISINLENAGVYNSTEVRTSDDCQQCGDFTSVIHCRFKCGVDMLVDFCKCFPFTYRRFYRADAGRKALPRCTVQMYEDCVRKYKYDSRCEDQTPCLVQNNHFRYDVSFTAPQSDENPHKLYLEVLCPMTSYIIFQTKVQNSWMQMLGQLGGNLGMFLSFSLFGVWQLMISCYLYYKTNRENQLAASSSIVADWLNQAKTNAGDTDISSKITDLIGKYEVAVAQNEVLSAANDALEKRLKIIEEKFGIQEVTGVKDETNINLNSDAFKKTTRL